MCLRGLTCYETAEPLRSRLSGNVGELPSRRLEIKHNCASGFEEIHNSITSNSIRHQKGLGLFGGERELEVSRK